jgi:putative CocE/NonD family hydrolase
MSFGERKIAGILSISFKLGLFADLLVVALAAFQAPPVQAKYKPKRFNRQEVMIPVRDGVRLQTVIFTPKHAGQALPFLMVRTPYGVPGSEDDEPGSSGDDPEIIADGYIFVAQNIRGRFKSEGTFVMTRPPRDRNDPKSIDEGTDTYDTIEWLLKNIPNNNGKVGIWGISYPGWLVTQALLEPHPALKAASEQASPDDMFVNDDFHHNGTFRLSYGFEYSALLESSKEKNTHFEFDQYDTYAWYLKLDALSNADRLYFHGKLPTWTNFVEHPNHDFWKQLAVTAHLKHTSVPNLNVAGWYDQEDFVGPTRIYAKLEETDTGHLNYFVAGPWNHGGWSRGPGRTLGNIDFQSDTAKYYRANILAPWFAYWLHGKGPLKEAEAVTFQTGSNLWKSYDEWPPKQGITPKRLFFRAGGKLAFDAPAESEAFDSYVSDPMNPVPYRARPVNPTYPGKDWPIWLLQDQRFVEHRPDVMTWKTDPLTEDVVVTGNIVADLFASTSGSDGDWIVKLIDVYPDDYQKITDEDSQKGAGPVLNGYELIVADDVLRGRFRNSLDTPEPITPNKVTEFKIDLHPNNHAFLKGHRIMVQVQSTWFPLYDRNPQKFVENIYKASDEDYVKATQKIYRSRDAASSIILPVAVQ